MRFNVSTIESMSLSHRRISTVLAKLSKTCLPIMASIPLPMPKKQLNVVLCEAFRSLAQCWWREPRRSVKRFGLILLLPRQDHSRQTRSRIFEVRVEDVGTSPHECGCGVHVSVANSRARQYGLKRFTCQGTPAAHLWSLNVSRSSIEPRSDDSCRISLHLRLASVRGTSSPKGSDTYPYDILTLKRR